LSEKVQLKNSAAMPQKKNNSKQTKNSAERNGDKLQNAYFLSLELENVRCFGEKQKIDFSDGNDRPKQWTIILGDNGTGKTTILQSALAMFPAPDFIASKTNGLEKDYAYSLAYSYVFGSREWLPFRYLSISKILMESKFAKQKQLKNTERNTIIIAKRGFERDSLLISDLFYVNGFVYGASRKAGNISISSQKEGRNYVPLFDEMTLLITPEEWLLQTDYASKRNSKFKEKRSLELELVKKILIDILPDINNIRFGETDRGRTPQAIVEFQTKYGWVESKDLSLGYRTSMAWIVDFASRMFDLYPESENPLAEPAVVLIDEIDLHLHPKWQRELIDYLTNLFPNTQFIVTTHSPLIVQAAAARDANIVVCRREGDHVVIDQSVEAVRNWRTDQILTSDLFDLPTDRAKNIEPLLEERQKILSKAKLTQKDEKRLEELEKEIGSVPVMENPKYDEAMDIILRAAEKLGKENGVSNDSHKKASKSSADSKR